MVKKSQKLFVMKNKTIGVVYGIILGELVQMNMVNQFMPVCIVIYGQMDQKNV